MKISYILYIDGRSVCNEDTPGPLLEGLHETGLDKHNWEIREVYGVVGSSIRYIDKSEYHEFNREFASFVDVTNRDNPLS